MEDRDLFSRELIEEAKHFFEKAKKEADPQGKNAYLHASLLIGFGALESHINSIVDDFAERRELTLLEKSILFEKKIVLEAGEFRLTEQLKMYRLDERIEFILRRFSGKAVNKNAVWWSKLQQGINFRNKLIHPKGKELINESIVNNSLQAILDTLNIIYKTVYKRRYPLVKRGLLSLMNF